MEKVIINFLFDFLLMFVAILIVYFAFVNRRKKNYSKLRKNDEVRIFVLRYNLDMKKQNYKSILNAIAISNSFILSFTSTLILNIKSMFWSIIVCILVLIIFLYSIYEILGRYFKKKEEKL